MPRVVRSALSGSGELPMNRLRGYVVKLRDHCEQRLFTPLAVNRLRGYLVKLRDQL